MRGPGEDQQAEPVAAMQARVRASFARQAMMATLGAELVSIERGRAELTLPRDERFTQQHGFVHAGAVAAVLTASYTINLLAPAVGERFRITGTVVRAGRTLVVCRGDAFTDGAATPFAVMQATLTALYDRPGVQH